MRKSLTLLAAAAVSTNAFYYDKPSLAGSLSRVLLQTGAGDPFVDLNQSDT